MIEAAKCPKRDRVPGSRSSAERLRERRTFHKPRISLLASPFVDSLEGFAGQRLQ
jgi:hypothetical protein